MLFELGEEVVSQLNSKEPNEWSEKINDLLSSMRQCRHIIYMNRKTLSQLLGEYHEVINYDNKIMLKWIECKVNDYNAIVKQAKFKIVLTIYKKGYDKNIYYIPIDSIKLDRPTLITENESDFKFYIQIAKLFYKNDFQSINLQSQANHGTNIKGVVNLLRDENRYFLCIVDSDRKYATDKVGETSKIAKRVIDECICSENPYPIKLYILNVREKENLFPFSCYLNVSKKQKKFFEIVTKFGNEEVMRYIKIKEKFETTSNDSQYVSIYKDVIEECSKQNIINKNNVVRGIDSALLEQESNDFFENISKNEDKFTYLDNLCNKQRYIINDWKEIAQHIFDFGCCLSENIKFNV